MKRVNTKGSNLDAKKRGLSETLDTLDHRKLSNFCPTPVIEAAIYLQQKGNRLFYYNGELSKRIKQPTVLSGASSSFLNLKSFAQLSKKQ